MLVPLLSLVAIAAFAGLAIWRFAGSSPTLIISGALSIDSLSLVLDFVLATAGAAAVLLSWRARAPDDAGHGEYFAMLLFALVRHVRARGRDEPGHAVPGLRAAVHPALRDERGRDAARALARGRAQVPDHRVGRLGHAALRAGHGLRRDGLDRLRPDRPRAVEPRRPGQRSAPAHRHRLHDGRPGLQGLRGAVPPVDPGRLRGRPHAGDRLHGRGHEGGGLRDRPALLRPRRVPGRRRLGPVAGRAGHGDDHRRQRRRARPVVAEADARVVLRGPGGLPAGRRGRRQLDRRAGHGVLPRRVSGHEPRRVLGDHRPRARDGAGRPSTRWPAWELTRPCSPGP